MRRDQLELHSPWIGAGTVIAYGHWGRPVVMFPAEGGRAWELERHGMIDAVAGLVDAGRAKVYCVDSFDGQSWSNRSIALEDRARAHGAYEAWLLERVVPFRQRRLRRAAGDDPDRRQPRRLPRGQPRAQARRPVPGRRMHVWQLRPLALARLGRARRG